MNYESQQLRELERRSIEEQERKRQEQEAAEKREKRNTRRFWLTLTVGMLSAIGSIIAATASVISCLR